MIWCDDVRLYENVMNELGVIYYSLATFL